MVRLTLTAILLFVTTRCYADQPYTITLWGTTLTRTKQCEKSKQAEKGVMMLRQGKRTKMKLEKVNIAGKDTKYVWVAATTTTESE